MSIKTIFLLVVGAAAFAAADTGAVGDDWHLGAEKANARIQNYEHALATGNKVAIRQATLDLQSDPLAVKLVNQNQSDGFKTELNQHIEAIHADTKKLILEELKNKRGISADRVEFFEATNPRNPGDLTVGQDWDFTLRIDGRDVPIKYSRPIVHEAYYRAATGREVPPGKDAEHFAEQHALEVTDYQHPEAYGGSPQEGDAIIKARKNGRLRERLRDPTQLSQVIEYKSNVARNQAAKLREEGNAADAVGRDVEQIRQSTKQFKKQVAERVEAMGGKVPRRIQEAQQIMQKVDLPIEKGGLTPAQVREQLKAIRETPESVIRKSAELVEAVQVLQPPSKRGPPPTVPKYIQKAQEIIERADHPMNEKRRLDPKEVREQLKAMGETPESVIRKSEELEEAARVLHPPSKLRSPPDYHVDNVRKRIKNREIVDKLRNYKGNASEASPATEGQGAGAPPERSGTAKSPATEPQGSGAPPERAGTAKSPASEPQGSGAPAERSGTAKSPATEPQGSGAPPERTGTAKSPATEPQGSGAPLERTATEPSPATEPQGSGAPAERRVTEKSPASEPQGSGAPAERSGTAKSPLSEGKSSSAWSKFTEVSPTDSAARGHLDGIHGSRRGGQGRSTCDGSRRGAQRHDHRVERRQRGGHDSHPSLRARRPRLREKNVAEAEKYHGEGWNSTLTGQAYAVREFAGELLGTQIAQEEIKKEEKQAAKEGREPSYTRSTIKAIARKVGELLMIDTIVQAGKTLGQAPNSVTAEEVVGQGQEQVVRAWRRGK